MMAAIDDNFDIGSEVSGFFGYSHIIIQKGSYQINYSTYNPLGSVRFDVVKN